MKYVKLFEEWSPKFHKTLQGASAIATSTNKGFGKAAKAVKDYAEKQINKEEFSLEFENGDKLILTHDANFLLNPISEFLRVNSGKKLNDYSFIKSNWFYIPVKVKGKFSGPENWGIVTDTENPVIMFRAPSGMGEGLANASVIFGPLKEIKDAYGYPGKAIDKMQSKTARFSNKSELENFIAMSIQSILSSPEKGFILNSSIPGIDVNSTPDKLGMDSFPEGMTREKFIIISLFKSVILEKDMRQFTM
jgi:hypothetical protein